jgi:hypothetical protein
MTSNLPGPGQTLTEEQMLRLLGIGPERERLEANLAAFLPIFEELLKLRSLDLSEVHPAIVFDPFLPYRKADGAD